MNSIFLHLHIPVDEALSQPDICPKEAVFPPNRPPDWNMYNKPFFIITRKSADCKKKQLKSTAFLYKSYKTFYCGKPCNPACLIKNFSTHFMWLWSRVKRNRFILFLLKHISLLQKILELVCRPFAEIGM